MKREKRLVGRVDPSVVRMLDLPTLETGLLERYRALPDLTGCLSDAMDNLDIRGAVPGSVLRARTPGARIVGRALTLRNARLVDGEATANRARRSRMGEFEAHNLAEPGDVLVVQGVSGVSNMGGISARLAKRAGECGAIVDGDVRDIEAARDAGFAIWSRGLSPITGKWRIQAVEINGTVEVAGVQVEPGAIVAADETGVCFVPLTRARDVIEHAEKIAASEEKRLKDIEQGVPIGGLSAYLYAIGEGADGD